MAYSSAGRLAQAGRDTSAIQAGRIIEALMHFRQAGTLLPDTVLAGTRFRHEHAEHLATPSLDESTPPALRFPPLNNLSMHSKHNHPHTYPPPALPLQL